ncbi:SMP-30/gluconolactonase/LRE family protein [Streptomyces sp. NPDC058228]|uniref:SMP-30/gluconolactonase/LRE family protein n=1 Tax=Streptomyces sp. NPDC058228 TaxID=3346390 RepID=UPI0036F0796B
MTGSRTISRGHTFLESPRWHEGALYVSDFFARQVLRFPGGDGAPEVIATVPGIPSGLGFLPGGDLLIVSMNDQTVYRLKGGQLEVYADLRGRVRGVLNDMLVDDAGRCYIGTTGHSPDNEADFGPTPLLIVQPDGEVIEAIDDLNFPNGIVKLDDGRLLVAETYAGTVRALKLDGDGIPVSAEVWAHWGREIPYFDIERAHAELEVEPDGLALGRDGTAWIADANGHGIARVREGGETVEFVDTGRLSVFAALAVDSRLFLCCSPRNRTVDWSALHSSELRVANIE